MRDHCGYAVIDIDGIEEPCGRSVSGWRWYQDCGHEDALEVACDWHANEGGRRIHDAEAKVARVEALAAGPTSNGYQPYAIALPNGVHLVVLLDDLRDALKDDQ